jgi:hypothetical protein
MATWLKFALSLSACAESWCAFSCRFLNTRYGLK